MYIKTNFIKFIFSLIVVLSISACGGGGSDANTNSNNEPDPDPDTIVPTASLTPTNLTTNIDSITNITATFYEDMFASTINAGSFTLSDLDGDIAATVSFDATTNIATLNPNTSLALLKSYTSRLTTDITDLSGNPLAQTTTMFTTRDGTWNGPVRLLDGASGPASFSPKIAVNPNGDAIVVFSKTEGAVNNIYANSYTVNDGWSSPVRIDAANETSYYSQVAIDTNGNAIVVWVQGSTFSALDDVYANRYTAASSSWGTAEIIDNSDEFAFSLPSIAMDSTGNATAVWNQRINSITDTIRRNSYNVATGTWAGVATDTPINDKGLDPKITIGTEGTHVVLWLSGSSAGDLEIEVSKISNGGSRYLEDDRLNTNVNGSEAIDNYQAVVDSKGNVTIVWQQPDVNGTNTYARYLAADGSEFTNATLIETTLNEPINTEESSGLSLAVDPSGNVIAVWLQYDGVRHNVWANRFSNFSKTWGTAELIEENMGTIFGAQLKIAAGGINTFSAIWNEAKDGGGKDIWTNRFTPNGWGTAEMIESSPGDTQQPVIGFDSRGNGIAVWIQMNGGRGAVHVRHFN